MNNRLLTLRWLRWTSLTEGATLIFLVCLAVPLKRMAGMPEFVTVLGPLHGAAFLLYVAMVMRSSSTGLLSAFETVQLLLVAFVPFGAFFMAGLLRRKAAELAATLPSVPLTARA